jgi:hypothetical protein
MAGYLDQYGAGEERREKIIKRSLLALVILLVVGGTLTLMFYNYRQEGQVRHFVELLRGQQYQAAYALWIRRDSDKRDYPFDKFLEDWGPKGTHADLSQFRISKSRSCGSGVILTVDFGKNQENQEKLWVERSDLVIGYSPLPGCPAPHR